MLNRVLTCYNPTRTLVAAVALKGAETPVERAISAGFLSPAPAPFSDTVDAALGLQTPSVHTKLLLSSFLFDFLLLHHKVFPRWRLVPLTV